MTYLSPELSDALIINRARRRGTPSAKTSIIDNATAQQARDRNVVEGAGHSLALQDRSLDLSGRQINEAGRQFSERMKFNREAADRSSLYGNIATGLSALGVGVSLGRRAAANRRAAEEDAWRQSIMDKYGQRSQVVIDFWDNLAKRMEKMEY